MENEPKKKSLTVKQERFCQEYILTGNKTLAYKTAYCAEKMKPSVINNKSCLLSQQDNIRERIDALKEETLQRNRVTVDKLVNDLGMMVNFDVATMFDENGHLKNVHDLPLVARMMITQIETFDQMVETDKGKKKKSLGKVSKVRLLNKLDVFEKLMKNLGGYERDKPIIPANQNVVNIYQLPDNKRD